MKRKNKKKHTNNNKKAKMETWFSVDPKTKNQ